MKIMSHSAKNEKKFWAGTLLIVFISIVLVFLPTVSVFSQTAPKANNDTSSYNAKKRQYIDLLGNVFDFVHRNYVDEVDPEILYQGAMKGLMDSLEDPYTTYMDLSMTRDITDTTSGNFGGVGLQITKAVESTPEKPAYVEVSHPMEDTPGYLAGIQPQDKIIVINGTDTSTITMDEVLGLLRGEIGTTVDLIIRRGTSMEFPVTLTRALIEVPTVKYAMIGQTGYLRIIEFTPQTPQRVQEALDSFQKNKFTNLIIDLRNNPGGLITSVVEVADKFIDDGPIVSTKSRLTYENFMYTASPKQTTMPKNIPIVVLINKGSASASEILAGALKDNHLAYLVGDRTYGKGSVQKPLALSATDGIKLTTARYYTPTDTNIDKIGIPPDMEVSFPELTEQEQEAYIKFMEDEVLSKRVTNPNMSENEIAQLAKELNKTYPINQRLLRRLIRLEADKVREPRLYDLDYDIQLNAALEVVQKKDFNKLVKEAKTLKELQQEAEEENKDLATTAQ